MAPKKEKKTKMSLNAFLTDDTFGAWDEMDDLPTTKAVANSIPPPSNTDKYSSRPPAGYDRPSDRFDRPSYDKPASRFERSNESAPTQPEKIERPAREFGENERGSKFEANQPSRYEQRSYQPDRAPRNDRPEYPIPDKPPYTAYVFSLSYDTNEENLANYFEGLQIEETRITKDYNGQSKGFGYVTFKNRESLEESLERGGGELQGRVVRVAVAEPGREDRRGARESSDGKVRDFDNWERKGPLPRLEERTDRRRGSGPDSSRSSSGSRQEENNRSFDNWRSGSAFDGLRRATPDRSREGSADVEEKPRERKRLQLKPRTLPVEGADAAVAADSASAPRSDKPNPFGRAAPVDTAKKQSELEERLANARTEAQQKADKVERAERPARPERQRPATRPDRAEFLGARRNLEDKSAVTQSRPKADASAPEDKKEDASAVAKSYDLLRSTEHGDDYVPDEEDEAAEDTAAATAAKAEKAAEAPVEAIVAEVNGSEDNADWSVVPKSKRVNGK
ncbi:hypothetical protein V1514DRAFT_341232 [Lipomyces japonicus]|uniref:uncharacterized protein n=1 Tax=Lipomyces japonicus TaxID=56871 RepID=UPI0034CEACB9